MVLWCHDRGTAGTCVGSSGQRTLRAPKPGWSNCALLRAVTQSAFPPARTWLAGGNLHGQSFAMSPFARGHEMLAHADNIGMTLAVLAGATCDRTILVGAVPTGSDEGALWTRPAVAAIVAAIARKAIVTDFCVLLVVVMVLPLRLG